MNLKQKRNEVWGDYKLLMTVHAYSPILNDTVLITLKGWKHITEGDKKRRRNPADIYRRLLVVKYLKMIIETATSVFEVRHVGSHTYYALEMEVDGAIVRVVIQEDEHKNFCRFSSEINCTCVSLTLGFSAMGVRRESNSLTHVSNYTSKFLKSSLKILSFC